MKLLRSLTVSLVAACFFLCNCAQNGNDTSTTDGSAAGNLTSSTIGRDGSMMVLIPAGDFFMGDPREEVVHYDENPCHQVYLDAFWIDCYEVSNRIYKRFIDETGHRFPAVDAGWAEPYNWKNGEYPPGTADFPVVLVSWDDAAAYAAWAGKRLPTEAEWEKAARSGMVKKQYPWGDNITEKQANHFTSLISSNKLKPVGSFPATAFGLYDMAGNVWEWCSDWYGQVYYRSAPASNPKGPEQGLYRVFRGGAWINREEQLRCSERARNAPSHQSHVIGFRCASSFAGRQADAHETAPAAGGPSS